MECGAKRTYDPAMATPATDNPRPLRASRQRMDCVRLAAAFGPVPPQVLISVHCRKISDLNPPAPDPHAHDSAYLIQFFSICVDLRSKQWSHPSKHISTCAWFSYKRTSEILAPKSISALHPGGARLFKHHGAPPVP